MARGRLISRTLGSSRKFAELRTTASRLGEFTQALYPLLVANSDDFGRLQGDAFTVKHAVFPTSPRSESDFEQALEAMTRVGLLERYAVEGRMVIQIVDFDRHQTGLHKRTRSDLPEPPPATQNGEHPGTSGKFSEIPSEEKRTEEKRTEESTAPAARRAGAAQSRLSVAPHSDDALFDQFWKAYPRHKDKDRAQRAFRQLKVTPALLETMLVALDAQKRSHDWQRDNGQYIPHPSTWLNHRRWEDELEDRPRTDGAHVSPDAAPAPELPLTDVQQRIKADCEADHVRPARRVS